MASFVLRIGIKPRPLFTSAPTRNVLRQLTITPRHIQQRPPKLLLAVTSIAGISSLAWTLHCDDAQPSQTKPSLPPPPKSSINALELTFGTVCGVCAGVFVKKSARMVAFFLGGLFVILQYLGSVSLIKVDWTRMASRFENLFYTTDAIGNRKPPTVRSIWKWIANFLTADFQPRASFIVGFALGLRVG